MCIRDSTNDQIDKATTAFFAGDDDNIPALIKKVALTVSYDMGWQKRSTGKLYDSLSGHGFIFGCKTGNIIGFRVKSKACSTCALANSLNVAPEDHKCQINWDGASGAMEAGVALEFCIDIHANSGYPIYIEKICSDMIAPCVLILHINLLAMAKASYQIISLHPFS